MEIIIFWLFVKSGGGKRKLKIEKLHENII